MNLIGSAPEWLLGILSALVAAAGLQDIFRLRISNVFPLGILIAGIVAMFLRGVSMDVWENLVIFGALLALGTLLFARGHMGGGDVKLFAAVGLWTDFAQALILIPAVLIAGGALALILLSRRLIPRSANAAGLARTNKKVPYGVAIAIGTLILVGLQAQLNFEKQDQLAKLSALTSSPAR